MESETNTHAQICFIKELANILPGRVVRFIGRFVKINEDEDSITLEYEGSMATVNLELISERCSLVEASLYQIIGHLSVQK